MQFNTLFAPGKTGEQSPEVAEVAAIAFLRRESEGLSALTDFAAIVMDALRAGIDISSTRAALLRAVHGVGVIDDSPAQPRFLERMPNLAATIKDTPDEQFALFLDGFALYVKELLTKLRGIVMLDEVIYDDLGDEQDRATYIDAFITRHRQAFVELSEVLGDANRLTGADKLTEAHDHLVAHLRNNAAIQKALEDMPTLRWSLGNQITPISAIGLVVVKQSLDFLLTINPD